MSIGLIIDIAIVIILIGFALVGLKKGFLDQLLKIIGSVGALLIAIFGAKPATVFLDGLFNFTQMLGGLCINWTCGSIDPALLDTELNASTLETFKATINEDGLTIPERLINSVIGNASVDCGMTFREVIATGMGTIFGMIVAGVVIFILVKLIVKILAKLFDSKDGDNGGSGLNKVLGGAFGLVKGCVFVVVVYTILSVGCIVFPISAQVTEIENTTTIFKTTYEPYSEMVQNYVNDKMGNLVENITNNLMASSATIGTFTFDYNYDNVL